MKLTEEQVEALDNLLGYILETEEEDYHQRLEEDGPESVVGHVYDLALTLVKAFGN